MERSALPDLGSYEETVSREIISTSDPAVLESPDKRSQDVIIPPTVGWKVMSDSAYTFAKVFFRTSVPNVQSIGPSTVAYSPAKTMERMVFEPPTTWSPFASPKEIDVLSNLAKSGLHGVADRLNELIEMFARDSDVDCLNLDSFRSVARFFMQNRNLSPDIVAGWDGYLSVDWRLPTVDSRCKKPVGEGILWLEFLPDGQIEYVGFMKETIGGPKIEFNDVARHENIICEISPFLKRMQ